MYAHPSTRSRTCGAGCRLMRGRGQPRLRRCGRPGGNPLRASLATAPPAGVSLTATANCCDQVPGYAQQHTGLAHRAAARVHRQPTNNMGESPHRTLGFALSTPEFARTAGKASTRKTRTSSCTMRCHAARNEQAGRPAGSRRRNTVPASMSSTGSRSRCTSRAPLCRLLRPDGVPPLVRVGEARVVPEQGPA